MQIQKQIQICHSELQKSQKKRKLYRFLVLDWTGLDLTRFAFRMQQLHCGGPMESPFRYQLGQPGNLASQPSQSA